MIVKLSLLDRQNVVHYPGQVDVFTNCDSYHKIGNCKIFRDKDGRHFGEVHLDEDISGDLFFYYRYAHNDAGIFIFTGLDLLERELMENPTTRLNDMIVG